MPCKMSVRTDLIKVYGKGYDKGLKHFKDMLSDNGNILNLIQFKYTFNSGCYSPKMGKGC